MKNKNKIMHYINILLVILCMLTIFLFSCENAEKSTERSDAIINSIINVSSSENNFTVDNTETGDITIVTIVRKCAHFFEFFLLGFLVVNLFKDYKKLNFKRILLCILFCCIYAVSDEIHQLFVDGRSCELIDVLVDTSGSSVGALFYYFLYSNVNKTKVIKE
jgi:VanZ family protein